MKLLKSIIICLALSASILGCGKKKEQSPNRVKREVVKPVPIIKKDTSEIIKEVKTIVEIEKPSNKYFLIAASFVNEDNANRFKDELIKQGYDSEIIVRKKGKNQDFYKVSYKGFTDRAEAFNELASAQRSQERNAVWLLINE